ncbi:MAG: hypothetical protein IJ930_01190 [Lachnospiraceae bacterium]|nr:hypothetical protein [Lachnospiraceae bacterium]
MIRTVVSIIVIAMFFRLSDKAIRSQNTLMGTIFGVIGIAMVISLIAGFLGVLWKILPVFVIGALVYLLVKK